MIATRATVSTGPAPARWTRGGAIAASSPRRSSTITSSTLRRRGRWPSVVPDTLSRVGIVAGAAEQEPPETSSSSGEVDPDAESFRRELKAAQEEEEDKERRTYRGIDTKGGRYGFGENVDDALDATTNPDSFLFGGFLFVIGAVVLFLFGPRPPSELYY